MFQYEDSLVRMCLLLVLLLQYCSTGAARKDVKSVIVPNQQQPIDQCRFHIHRHSRNPYIRDAEKPVSKHQIDHMAAIGWSQPNGTIIWQCGGSLIWENYVLTAAHCAADINNIAPDVVRFGDLNRYKDKDNYYAQQRKIVEIIRHPDHISSQKYHDIALMRLEKKVWLVWEFYIHQKAPACLWNGDDVPFKRMEAAGWGDTGFDENSFPELLTVTLSPVEPKQCIQHYLNMPGLRAGLHANQICAGDAKMDTCRGNSGGPLHVKLLHNKKYTPFLVGVASFGAACGQSVPGVYTRVAPYIPWIRSVLQKHGEDATERTFQPRSCATRDFGLRMMLSNNENDAVYRYSHKTTIRTYSHIGSSDSLHHVTIHWNETNATKRIECYGVVIDENTILTLASCTAMDGIPPSHIRYKGNHTNAISNYFRHPDYKENSLYNNIGLLKLKESLEFSNYFFPACLYLDDDTHVQYVYALGQGSRQLNGEGGFGAIDMLDLNGFGHVHNASTCSPPSEYASLLEKGLTEELLCFGTHHYLLPGICDLSIGGPIEVDVHHDDIDKLPHVYALNLLGRDCGYGESALGVKIAYHREWIRSILSPEKDENDAPLIFLNDALEEGDHCVPAHGSDGICVEARYCPKVYYQFQKEGKVRFCQTGSLVCCPREFIRNETDAEWREIDECENHHVNTDDSDVRDQTVVSLGWKTETGEKTCKGTIITSRTIVVAANCVAGTESPASVSIQEINGIVLPVERAIVYPEFDNLTKQHNIALIHMQERFDKSFQVKPACLSITDNHIPLKLIQYRRSPQKKGYIYRYTIPIYSSDCDGYFGKRVLQPYELCVDVSYWYGETCTECIDAPALWNRYDGNGHLINYFIGIASQQSSNRRVLLHTRVSSYVNWIKSVL